MVNLGLSAEEGGAKRPIKSSAYHNNLKRSGKMKSEMLLRNKTSSYDKHYLVHTDITPTGRGNSYPHRKDFAWNFLYLKQSWGANLSLPKKQGLQSASSTSSNKNLNHRTECSVYKISRNKSDNKYPRSAPDQYLPPLPRQTSEASFRSAVSDASGFTERKRWTTESEKPRISTLDSIPENGPLNSAQRQSALREDSNNYRRETASSNKKLGRSRRSERSKSKLSRFSAASHASSHSSELSRLESRSSAASSSVASRSYREGSRASIASNATRWDEHEGRPYAEKIRAKAERDRKVANTIRPEVLKSLVGAVTAEMNSRDHTFSHMDSTAVGSTLADSYSVKQYHPFTNLKFEVEKSANTTRLRSSLYKTEEEMRQPTIFRSNLTETKKQKQFNPRFHGDVTRPSMVGKHTHKHALEGFFPTKWVPKANVVAESGPWTTYKAE